MTIERVSVSLPSEVRHAAQRFADEAGLPFSSVVSDALVAHLRGKAVDEWLDECEARHGGFSEDQLKETAAALGIPYIEPLNAQATAA